MNRFVALMYHNVCQSTSGNGRFGGFDDLSPSVTNYFIEAGRFSSHCEVIARSGKALEVGEFARRMQEGHPRSEWDNARPTRSPPDPRVLLTFDDGWRGSVEVGGPVLETYGLQALLFVTTDLIGHPYFVDRSLLQHLPRSFVVGSHAKTHRPLSQLGERAIRAELVQSKAVLEDLVGYEVKCVAFPGGSFDRRVRAVAREAGYRWMFTSRPQVNPFSRSRHSLGRLAVKSGTTVETLSRWLDGDLRRERLRSLGLEAGKRLLGRALYHRLRSRLLSENATQLEMTDLAAASRQRSDTICDDPCETI